MRRHLFVVPLALTLVAGCSESQPPAMAESPAQAQDPPAAMGPNPVPAPGLSQPGPEPGGPHGQHDPHALLDPSRLIKVALQHEREGRHELALETLAEAIDKFPDTAQLYSVRASLFLQNQQFSNALRDLEQAVKLAPDDARIRVNRAQAYRAFGRFEAAMQDLDIAAAQDPDLLPARFNRGAMFYARRDFEKAMDDFDHCVAVDPEAPAPYFNRASTYWELGQSDEALSDLERFLELTDNPEWKKAAEDLRRSWMTILAAKAEAADNE